MSDQEPEDELARSDRAWAAQAEAYANPQVPSPAPVGGGGPSAGSSDRPKGPRPVRGPKGNAMGWLRGLGLLSILLTIGIMALLSWRVLSDTGGDDDVAIVRGTTPSTVPGAPATDPGAGAQLGEGGSTDQASAAACEVDRATVETAAMAYEVGAGAPPADLQTLVDAGYLKPGLDLQVEITADGTVVSTGTCAGG